MELQDPRLQERKRILLNETKLLINLLEEKTGNINWEMIANLGEEIKLTAETAMSLDCKKNTHTK